MTKAPFKTAGAEGFKKSTFITCVLFLPALLSACNTMGGLGTDVKQAGKTLEDSAERNKPNSPPCPCCNRR